MVEDRSYAFLGRRRLGDADFFVFTGTGDGVLDCSSASKINDQRSYIIRRKKLLSIGCFSVVGEGNDVPYSGDISFTDVDVSIDVGAGGGEDGVSKLVEGFN
jgi:hypothetical protein